jgi:hypothetical protein
MLLAARLLGNVAVSHKIFDDRGGMAVPTFLGLSGDRDRLLDARAPCGGVDPMVALRED